MPLSPWLTSIVLPRVRPGRFGPALQGFVEHQRLQPCDRFADELELAVTWREDEALRAAFVSVTSRDDATWSWARALARHLATATGARALLVCVGAEEEGSAGSSTWVGGQGWQVEPDGRGRALELPDPGVAGFSNPVGDDCPTEEFHLLFAASCERLLRREDLVAAALEDQGAEEAWSAPPLHADPRVAALARRALWAERVGTEVAPDGRTALRLQDGDATELVFPDAEIVRAVLRIAQPRT